MGVARPSHKVKLVAGLLANDTELFDKIKRLLEKKFHNAVDFETCPMDFVHTDYYKAEMGDNIKRKFLSFKKHIPLKNIYRLKLITNVIESKFLKNGKRTVNIDPGYIDLGKLVLLSTKDYTHRIYLNGGIFAEVTLHYKDRSFNPWPWTYPDYQTAAYIGAFNKMRELYKGGLN